MDLNYYTPVEIARIFCETGQKKARSAISKLFALSLLAGIFVALAATGSNEAIHDISLVGIAKALAGAMFGCSLMLVMIAGGELFTGDCLMVIALAEKRISLASMLRTWAIVYIGNFAGSLFLVFCILRTGQFDLSGGMVGGFTIKTAIFKTTMGFEKAFINGIFCNVMVCVAAWASCAAKDIAGKILAVFFPVWIFVAAGFEHSVANMYYIPAGILAKSNDVWVSKALELGVTPEQISALGIKTFLVDNLLPVTLGNIVGGSVLIGILYWFAYLRETVSSK